LVSQVWVYEEPETEGDEGNLYVHHDVMLPAFPLSVAWMDCDPSQRRERANLAAVGEHAFRAKSYTTPSGRTWKPET